jgi:fatty-acyl-CoA synthase
MHIATILEAIAQGTPSRPAVVSGGTARTWEQFDDRASRFAGVLRGARLSLFGSVGICMRNSNEYLEVYVGTLKMRGVPININYRYVADELVCILTDSNCEVLVCGAAFLERIVEVRHRVPSLNLVLVVDDGTRGPDANGSEGIWTYEDALSATAPAPPVHRDASDPLISYTGGTTGLPKGLTASVGSKVVGRVGMYARQMGFDDPGVSSFTDAVPIVAEAGQTPVGLPASPLMHGTGLVACALPTLLFGGTLVNVTTSSFEPATVLAAAERHAVTAMTMVGDAMGKPLLAELDARAATGMPYGLDRLRAITSSGMSWSQATKAGLFRHLPDVQLLDLFGATEGMMGTSLQRRANATGPATRFTPVDGLKILREDDSEAPIGELGRIAFPVDETVHYRGDEEATRRSFRHIRGQRFAVLGDLGRILPDGQLEALGRGSQVINTGGEKVYPAEVEDVIRGIDGVLDCLVFGLPDSRWGQQVVAVVARCGESSTAEVVRAAVRDHLAGYKVPKHVVVVPAVPRHPNGKADLETAARLAHGALPSAYSGAPIFATRSTISLRSTMERVRKSDG